jgi:SprT protein
MSQYERNTNLLKKYIPEPAAPLIARWIVEYDFKLKITRGRNSKLGDYRSPQNGSNHIITVNHNLNKYAFFITLVHEVAHLITFNKHKDTVLPHGQEWKHEYKNLMRNFMSAEIFPTDILLALQKYLINPAASSCSDSNLLRVLKRYDEAHTNGHLVFVEKVPNKSVFKYNGDKLFEKGERIRTRYRCTEVASGTTYLFHALTEVELVKEQVAVSS